MDGGKIVIGGANSFVGINNGDPTVSLEIRQVQTGAIERGLMLVSPMWSFDRWEMITTRAFSYPSTKANFAFYYNGMGRGHISAVDGGYSSLSDARFKKNISPLSFTLQKLMKLRPVSYHMIEQSAQDKQIVGFIAQEVESIFPELVSKGPVNHNMTNRAEDVYTMNYAGFGVLAVKAIQEQQNQIEELKADNQKLRKEIEEIKRLLILEQ